ncbi:hypothetical protein [Aestuariibacter sp. GS-14]|nr:hypothetical protein [Aestuariibacter sp. GS-14]
MASSYFVGSHSHLDEESVYYRMSTDCTNKTMSDFGVYSQAYGAFCRRF